MLTTVCQADHDQFSHAVHSHVVELIGGPIGALECFLPAETSMPAAAIKVLPV
jgi:hypothetical protein